MKRIVILLIGLFIWVSSNSQTDHAIGLRLGGGTFFGSEISYQNSLWKSPNRIELNLGVNFGDGSGTFINGLYQWVNDLEPNWQWYYGVGGGIGFINETNDVDTDDGIYIVPMGDIGLEYYFEDIPLQLFADFRIGISLINSTGVYGNLGIGARYTF